MAEFDAVGSRWRSNRGLLSSCLAAFVGVDFPGVVGVFEGPFGGEGEVLGDGFAEVVGGVAGEPSVELVAVAYRVGGGSFGPAVRGGDILVFGFGACFACVEGDCMGGVCSGVSGQRLVDRVVQALGEGLTVLSASECDGGWSGLAGGYVRLPGVAGLVEFEGLTVQAG